MTSQSSTLPRGDGYALSKPQPKAVGVSTKVRAAQRKAAAMKWLRRAHLYSGLLLLPWVLIYGISGFLFNHGSSSSSAQLVPIPADQLQHLAGQDEDLGSRLLAAIDRKPADAEATVAGSWSFDFHDPDQDKDYRLSLPVDGSDGRLSERRRRSSRSLTYERDTFATEREQAQKVARATLASISMLSENLRVTSGPSLRISSGKSRWSTTLTRDRVTESTASDFDFSRLMRRLHVTHGYSRSDWARIAWAVIVDIMAFAMVLWAISGFAMWWQKKSLRTPGAVTLFAAFTGSAVLVIALQGLFTS
ncbi:PepSY domain-containing protein [bacterium]|nr:PepSY domain-containing protein [bacterium]